jgi:uncharacterized protein (TIGR01244 family)
MPASAPSRAALALKRAAAAATLILAVAVLSAGAIYGHWVWQDHRLTVVTPGRVYQSAQMPAQDLIRLAGRLGIQTVFDFRGDGGIEGQLTAAEQQALEGAGIKYVHIPSSTHPDPATVARFVRSVGPELAAHRTVLLHCKDGEGRSVFYSAVYRMQFEGWSNEQAYQGTTRLPPQLMFLTRVMPSLGRLSAHNAKTPLILTYQRQAPDAEPALAPAATPAIPTPTPAN